MPPGFYLVFPHRKSDIEQTCGRQDILYQSALLNINDRHLQLAFPFLYASYLLSISYIPITFRPRQGGVNSISIPKIIKIGKQAIKDFRKINKTISKK